MSERCRTPPPLVTPKFGTLLAVRDWKQLGTAPRMITVRIRKAPSKRSLFPSHLAACLVVLSMTVQAFGADQVDGKRRSLILRPVGEHMRAGASGLSPEAQTSIRATVSPTTPSSSASSPRRLAKYPDVSSSTSQGIPIAAVASAKAGHQPVAGTRPSQPIAASGTGATSRYRGSRAVMNLLNIPGLVNLLQAPLPPVVTTASHPPTSPKSTPQMAPSTSSNPQPSPSSGGSAPNTHAGNPSSNQPSNTPAPVQKTGNAVLSWNLGTENDLAGYKVYIGTTSGTYSYPGSPFTIGRVTTYKVDNLPRGQTYYFALSAYDNAGNTSALSAEVHKSIY